MSAKASERSSVRNANPQMLQSHSTSNSNQPRPPFIHSLFLVLVHGTALPRLIQDAHYPALDSIAHRGVTTAVMLTPSMCESADNANGLASYMHATAKKKAQFDAHAIRIHDADDVHQLFRKPTLPDVRGVHLIRAPDLSTADRVVADVTAALSPLLCDRQTTAAAVGFLLTGDGDWSQLVALPGCFGSGLVKLPRQSYEIGVDETPSLGGLMCMAGKGIVRKDLRERLAHCYGPGDGCLRPDQIVLEMLSKTELVLKFGA